MFIRASNRKTTAAAPAAPAKGKAARLGLAKGRRYDFRKGGHRR